jgi:hypothetical protein
MRNKQDWSEQERQKQQELELELELEEQERGSGEIGNQWWRKKKKKSLEEREASVVEAEAKDFQVSVVWVVKWFQFEVDGVGYNL